MQSRISRILAPLVFAAALSPAGLAAQEAGPVAPPQLPPEAQELIAELQEIQSRLEPIQREAFQDPELAAEQQELSMAIQSAMIEADASVPEQMERLQTLMGEARGAREAGDGERMAEVVTEAQEIEQRLQSAQATALQHPEVAPRVERFQAHLRERIVAVDPEAESLLERAEEIDARLRVLLDPEG